MDAYKCDICGGFYTAKTWNYIGELKVLHGTPHSFSDICPDCVKAIQKVIDERTGINDKE